MVWSVVAVEGALHGFDFFVGLWRGLCLSRRRVHFVALKVTYRKVRLNASINLGKFDRLWWFGRFIYQCDRISLSRLECSG